jgi:hypothetical protein
MRRVDVLAIDFVDRDFLLLLRMNTTPLWFSPLFVLCTFCSISPSFAYTSSLHMIYLTSNSSQLSPSQLNTTFNTQHDTLDAVSLNYPGLSGSGTRVSVIRPCSVYQTLTLNSTNLTVTFFPSRFDTCFADNITAALIFNVVVGMVDKNYERCYNVEDILRSSHPSISDGSRTVQSDLPPGEFSWRLLNTNAYPADIAYSRILYTQQNITSPSPGEDAQAYLSVFSGRYCQPNASLPHNGYPTVSWSCQTSNEGDCYKAPYNILSIEVGSAAGPSRNMKKCVTRWGDAATKGISSGSTTAIVGTVIMLVAGLLSW